MKKHIQDFKRFGLNEYSNTYDEEASDFYDRFPAAAPEGPESSFEKALLSLDTCQMGLLIKHSTEQDYIIKHLAKLFASSGKYKVANFVEAKRILLDIMKHLR